MKFKPSHSHTLHFSGTIMFPLTWWVNIIFLHIGPNVWALLYYFMWAPYIWINKRDDNIHPPYCTPLSLFLTLALLLYSCMRRHFPPSQIATTSTFLSFSCLHLSSWTTITKLGPNLLLHLFLTPEENEHHQISPISTVWFSKYQFQSSGFVRWLQHWPSIHHCPNFLQLFDEKLIILEEWV